MNPKWYRASIGIAVLLALVLAVSGLLPKVADAQDGEPPPWEQEPWDVVLQSFQELAQQSAYDKLDEEFTQLGTDVLPIQRTQKILDVIGKLDNIKTYYESVIAAEPSQQAGIDFLEGVAAGLTVLADVPVPLVGQFLEFYAWGINECVIMLRQIDETLRETCIKLVNAGITDFAVYQKYEPQVQALLKKKQQEELAKRASRAVAEKKRLLERKKSRSRRFASQAIPWLMPRKALLDSYSRWSRGWRGAPGGKETTHRSLIPC